MLKMPRSARGSRRTRLRRAGPGTEASRRGHLDVANVEPPALPEREAAAQVAERDHEVQRLQGEDRRPDRRLAEDVAGEQGDEGLLDPERVLRRHEELAHGRARDAENEPRELARTAPHD